MKEFPPDPSAIEQEIRSKIHNLEFSGEGIEARNNLAQELQQSEGKLMLLMHPFYEEQETMPSAYLQQMQESPDFRQRLIDCNSAIDSTLAEVRQMPLVIFEDRTHSESCFSHCVQKQINLSGNVYMMTSLKGMGTPLMEDKRMTGIGEVSPLVVEKYRRRTHLNKGTPQGFKSPLMNQLTVKYITTAWANLLGSFRNLGVKEIYLGGKYLDTRSVSDGTENLDRCLGEVYNYMDLLTKKGIVEGVSVKFTDMTFPKKRI